MQMIIGGANQGQLAWAKAHFENLSWIDGKTCDYEQIETCEGIFDFHEFIKRMMKDEISTEDLAELIIENNPDIVIVSDEIGYGLVPVDRFLREYREQTGRICTKLAAFSKCVVRVILGIGTTIKEP